MNILVACEELSSNRSYESFEEYAGSIRGTTTFKDVWNYQQKKIDKLLDEREGLYGELIGQTEQLEGFKEAYYRLKREVDNNAR